MKKYLFLILALIIIMPQACKKDEHIVWVRFESPRCLFIYEWGVDYKWGEPDEGSYNERKQTIILFFKSKGIEILEINTSETMTMGPECFINCKIYKKDLALMRDYGFDLF